MNAFRNSWLVARCLTFALALGVSPQLLCGAEGQGAPSPQGFPAPGGQIDNDGSRRGPVPSADEQRQATAKVRQIFANDYVAAKAPSEKQRLASVLFSVSKKTHDTAEAWALICEAVRLAADAGDVAFTLDIVDSLAERYDVDTAQVRMDALAALAEKSTPQSAEDVARHLLTFAAGEAQSDGELRRKAIRLASVMARKAKNAQLSAHIAQARVRWRREEEAAKELGKALARVKENPDDADACLETGSLLCFTHDDWEPGLALLARCSDATLAVLARSELAAAGEAAKVVAVAERWTLWAEGQKPAVQESVNLHARALFMSVVPRLEGLDRISVEKKIEALTVGSGSALLRAKDGPRSIPGLALWLDAAEPSAFEDGGAGRNRLVFDRVEKWKDLSGLGNDAFQPDPTKQPRRLTTAVEFDGNQFLSLVNPFPGTAFTILAVYRSTKNTTDTTLASTRTTSASGWMIDHQSGSIWLRAFSEASKGQATISPSTAEEFRVFVGRIDDSGSIHAQLAGMKPVTSAKRLDLKPSPTALAVGGTTGDAGGGNFRGQLQRLVIYSRVLDDDEVAALLAWNAKAVLR